MFMSISTPEKIVLLQLIFMPFYSATQNPWARVCLRECRPACPWLQPAGDGSGPSSPPLDTCIWVRERRPGFPRQWPAGVGSGPSSPHLDMCIWVRERRPACPWLQPASVGSGPSSPHLGMCIWVTERRPGFPRRRPAGVGSGPPAAGTGRASPAPISPPRSSKCAATMPSSETWRRMFVRLTVILVLLQFL